MVLWNVLIILTQALASLAHMSAMLNAYANIEEIPQSLLDQRGGQEQLNERIYLQVITETIINRYK